ncbi:hypothetical protein PENCOP_c008G00895 [Penicillium coprophilum]|uniref:HD domain-containing protein n=1 Tax=Penicillium coprophilum TaxID=36646 RepID=A0A1V6UIP6_9EURO|nr:hypothetical protein PENCOP_c008G00895 [Penicillium coprophilum]
MSISGAKYDINTQLLYMYGVRTQQPPNPNLNPSNPTAQRINAYARTRLPENTTTYDRSTTLGSRSNGTNSRLRTRTVMRLFFLACLLHDIGTNIGTAQADITTRRSFDFFDSMLALRVLQNGTHGDEDEDEADVGLSMAVIGEPIHTFSEAMAPRKQDESVAEAIIRHRDLSFVGSIAAVGQSLQLAMMFDFRSTQYNFISRSPETNLADTPVHTPISFMQIPCIKYVLTHFLRKCSSHCFAAMTRQQDSLMPWAQTTALDERFPADCLGKYTNGAI